jgi:hypothetical protein
VDSAPDDAGFVLDAVLVLEQLEAITASEIIDEHAIILEIFIGNSIVNVMVAETNQLV